MPNLRVTSAFVLALAACGEPPVPPDSDGAAARARVTEDSLREEVARLERALTVARDEARAAQAVAGADAARSRSGGAEQAAVDSTDVDEGTTPRRLDDPTRGLIRFATTNRATITYVGALRDGQAHGYGYGVWSTGSAYEGEWRENQRHGPGRHRYPDGARYEGIYARDLREGLGTYHYPNGQRWEGPWVDNLRHGEGILYEANGEVRVRGVWERDRLVRTIRP